MIKKISTLIHPELLKEISQDSEKRCSIDFANILRFQAEILIALLPRAEPIKAPNWITDLDEVVRKYLAQGLAQDVVRVQTFIERKQCAATVVLTTSFYKKSCIEPCFVIRAIARFIGFSGQINITKFDFF